MDLLIGAVPDNWTEHRLDKICEILAGPSTTSVDPTNRAPTDIPVVTPRDLRHNRIVSDCDENVSSEIARELARYRLRPDDIVCSRTGQLGRQALVSNNQHGWLIGSACIRLRARQLINAPYLVHYLGHPAVRDWIIRNTSGAVIPTLSTKMLGALPVALPPDAVQAAIAGTLDTLDQKIILHEQISNTAATLRDAVRLRLLSGADPASWLDDR